MQDHKEYIIGTVGRIESVKGIRYLLLAMKIILAKFPNTKLEIIGDGTEVKFLKHLALENNISNSVSFLGKFTDVIPFYKRMDIFVLPSVLEGFGIVLLEAMASGIPIVATNVNGIKEVVIDMSCGILVPPRNPEAIANAVIRLIENPEVNRKLVENGYERAKLFDIPNHIMKLEQLYVNLLGVESSQ
jgi:glycosyltransferase involved in cell wall biosynthesis